MTTEPTTQPHAPVRPAEATDLLPAPGGWVSTDDLARSTGLSHLAADRLLRQAAIDGRIVDGALLRAGGRGTWHRPGRATLADHTLLSGPVASGKTTALRTFWAVEYDDPTVNSWVCDTGGTLEADTAARRDGYAAGPQASIDLLTEARELISSRSTISRFRATTDTPLVIVSVDGGCQLLEDPQAVYLLEGITLLGPRLGVVPRVTTTSNRIADLGSALLWRNLNHPA